MLMSCDCRLFDIEICAPASELVMYCGIKGIGSKFNTGIGLIGLSSIIIGTSVDPGGVSIKNGL